MVSIYRSHLCLFPTHTFPSVRQFSPRQHDRRGGKLNPFDLLFLIKFPLFLPLYSPRDIDELIFLCSLFSKSEWMSNKKNIKAVLVLEAGVGQQRVVYLAFLMQKKKKTLKTTCRKDVPTSFTSTNA